ncbi:MAG: glutathione S-transferase N-terminal domain-containing protein [Bacteroidetes bacterium]|nr:glutathione S-transferase N-terminal domain-containing protein [Bacteroidota bacterium]
MNTPQPKVIIFTTPTCSFCRAAKQYFNEKKVRYTEVDVARDPRAAQDMMRRTGQMGVPVIMINNRSIVGFDKPKINQLLGIRD